MPIPPAPGPWRNALPQIDQQGRHQIHDQSRTGLEVYCDEAFFLIDIGIRVVAGSVLRLLMEASPRNFVSDNGPRRGVVTAMQPRCRGRHIQRLIVAATIATVVVVAWSGAAMADLSCKEFRRGYLLGDPDILQSVAEITTPLILAENGGTMPEDRRGAFVAIAIRLQIYCTELPDDSVDAIVCSLLKTAPERYAEAEAKRAADKAPADAAHAAKKAAEEAAQHEAGGPTKTHLTLAQLGAIGDYVRRCWSTDPGMLDLDKMQVLLTVVTDGSGVVRQAMVADEDKGRVASDMRLRVFSERAIRAVLDPNCVNLPLPPAMLGESRTFSFRYRP